MEFHIGREDNGNQFRYAICSCHGCNVFKHNRCIIQGNSEQKKEAYIMSDAQIHITCPRCNYSDTTSMPIGKYNEAVYQPCSTSDDEEDHNLKDQISCENCHNGFDFYWCAGHTATENDTRTIRERYEFKG